MSESKDIKGDVESLPTAGLADLFGKGPSSKWIEVDGKKVQIRKLTLGDLQLIYKFAKDDPFMTTVGILQKALINPSLNLADIKKIPPFIANKIVKEITEMSGWAPEQVEEAKNLS